MPKLNTIGYVILEDMQTPSDISVVEENNDRVVAEACLQEAEEENRNGRCYLTEDLTREQNCARTQELLRTGYMLGEAGHPTDTSIIRQQTIDPGNTAVRYLKFWMDGPKWMAHFQGTNNDLGQCIDNDLRKGYKPAFSMRALGSLKNINGRNTVRDLRYVTHDFVIFPSHPGAYTTRVVSEGGLYTGRDNLSEFQDYVKKNSKKIIRESSTIPIMNEDVISYIKNESANVQGIIDQFELLYENVTYDPKKNTVTMRTKNNDIFVVYCESYIKNEIEQYCYDMIMNG